MADSGRQMGGDLGAHPVDRVVLSVRNQVRIDMLILGSIQEIVPPRKQKTIDN